MAVQKQYRVIAEENLLNLFKIVSHINMKLLFYIVEETKVWNRFRIPGMTMLSDTIGISRGHLYKQIRQLELDNFLTYDLISKNYFLNPQLLFTGVRTNRKKFTDKYNKLRAGYLTRETGIETENETDTEENLEWID